LKREIENMAEDRWQSYEISVYFISFKYLFHMNFMYIPLYYHGTNVEYSFERNLRRVGRRGYFEFGKLRASSSIEGHRAVSKSEASKTSIIKIWSFIEIISAGESSRRRTRLSRAIFLNGLPHRRVFAFTLTISDMWMHSDRWELYEAKPSRGLCHYSSSH